MSEISNSSTSKLRTALERIRQAERARPSIDDFVVSHDISISVSRPSPRELRVDGVFKRKVDRALAQFAMAYGVEITEALAKDIMVVDFGHRYETIVVRRPIPRELMIKLGEFSCLLSATFLLPTSPKIAKLAIRLDEWHEGDGFFIGLDRTNFVGNDEAFFLSGELNEKLEPLAPSGEISAWLSDNISRKWWVSRKGRENGIMFSDQADAAMFRLCWG